MEKFGSLKINNMKQTIDNVVVGKFKSIEEEDGSLMPIEFKDLYSFFEPKRIFFIYGVEDQNDRGKHAHYQNKQLLICLGGQINVFVSDGERMKKIILNEIGQYVYIPNMIWDEQMYMSKDTILCSICSANYEPSDYIHDFKEYMDENER